MDTVMGLVGENALVIFSKSSCCISHSIKTLLTSSFGANPTIYEVDELPNGQQLERELLVAFGRRPSVPAVFIGQVCVGGSNEVMSLLVKGKLAQLLKDAKAIWV